MNGSFEFLSTYGYAALFGCVLAEQLGVPVPAAPVLLAAGALAGLGKLNLALALLLAVVASLIGDTVWYYLGKTRGTAVLRLLCKISLEPDVCVRQTNATYSKHGTRWLLFAKFIPGVSTIAPPMAGVYGVNLWMFIAMDGVERFTRVCSYDRAGYGQSDPGPQPRSSLQIARELHTVLEKTHTPGPYVLVGHSFGGYNVRVYTGLYRNEVAGVVLVDSSHEDQGQFEPASVRDQARGLQTLAPFVPLLRFFGVLRLRNKLQPTTTTGSKLSPATMQEISALALRPNFLPTVLREYATLGTESAAQVRSAGNLENLPLIVLTAGQATDPGNRDLDGFRKAWLDELQPSLAKLSMRGQQIVVQDSDHMIPYKDPEAIIRSIQSVWTEARSQR